MVIAKLNIISIFRYVNYILKFGYLLFGSGSKKFWFGFSVPEIKDPCIKFCSVWIPIFRFDTVRLIVPS